MSKCKSLDADSLSYGELMKNLEYNYSVGASEVVAETDKRVFEIIYKFAKGKKEYETTLLKGNTPNKNCVTFTSEALANAVENYNKNS